VFRIPPQEHSVRQPNISNPAEWARPNQNDPNRMIQNASQLTHKIRKFYAPPVSEAELSSARVGAMLGRPVNAAEWAFLCVFSSFVFSGFIIFFWFFVSFLFSLFFSYNSNYFLKFELSFKI
jgi:hypothetical protein